jgi:hypothetical protein
LHYTQALCYPFTWNMPEKVTIWELEEDGRSNYWDKGFGHFPEVAFPAAYILNLSKHIRADALLYLIVRHSGKFREACEDMIYDWRANLR